ncbi:MAG TPA: TonB-dependent receptor, partial [bacterium]|nr:TonB-dependent receptor [bacterium]
EYRKIYQPNNPVIRKLDDYILTDMRIEKTFKEQYSIYFNIQNLFDTDYYDMMYIPGAGRSYYIGCLTKF